MKRYILDTNALISFITNRDPGQQRTIEKHFAAASEMKESMVIHSHVITETVFVLQKVYKTPPELIKRIISSIRNNPGFIIDDNFFMEMVLEIWPDKIRDFGDALLAAYSRNMKIPILTFDKKLGRSLQDQKIPFLLLLAS